MLQPQHGRTCAPGIQAIHCLKKIDAALSRTSRTTFDIMAAIPQDPLGHEHAAQELLELHVKVTLQLFTRLSSSFAPPSAQNTFDCCLCN